MQSSQIDLSNCDREPIHQSGAIQPHGVLLVCRAPNLEVVRVSENAGDLIGLEPAALIGRPVAEIFRPEDAEHFEAALRTEVFDTKPVYFHTIQVREPPTAFDAITHRNGNNVLLELEPSDDRNSLSAPELYRLVQRSIARLQKAQSVDHLARVCADQVRKISGFDRVMVYRFDEEWNGQVISEERRDDLEPFLGLHYPASDIPAQARELYTRNWLRFIADCGYRPSHIVPACDAGSRYPLDLSFSVLRSVSPIHLEYLKNMGVQASMSISLIRDNRLWGLVACHHYSPRFVPYDVRTACELLGQLMSQSIASADDRELASYRATLRRVTDDLSENISKFEDTAKALVESTPTMLDFVAADGAAVVVGDAITRIGQTPGPDIIRELSAWLRHNVTADVYATDNVQAIFGMGRLSAVASGLLAVSLTGSRVHQLLWFRTELVREVHWAGDPSKSVVKGDGAARLSPRGSFALWKETLKGRSRPWTPAELDAAQMLRDRISRQMLRRSEQLASANTDMRLASQEHERALAAERAARAESERVGRAKDDFVATLSHELRTPLNAILGWAQILAQKEQIDQETADGLEVIERNARSQAKMIEDLLDVSRIISGNIRLDLQETNLPSIVKTAIETVSLAATAKGIRIETMIDPLSGLNTTGDPGRLQQVVWNLLSNAVKFTHARGKVQVILERVDSHVELSIADNGQGIASDFLPHVFDRFRQADSSKTRRFGGLGLGLAIVRDLVELHGGIVRAYSAGVGKGATFVVSLPVRVVQLPAKETSPESRLSGSRPDCEALNLKGVRVLALDDEKDARDVVKRMLEECDCEVTTAASIEDALEARRSAEFDVIISDIGMPDGDGYEFIKRWRSLEASEGKSKTPAVALTAYARADDRRKALLSGFQAHLAKPADSAELLALVASLAGRV
ncbi:Phytochrome-like protein cph1 [Caulifigura coniformis]|uniref:histidine kinase n=1 Tax=Caulifigura coniformis TaxID=2527983 RepID=A0A517SMP5_9PLAN|nr:ATP-binding protein [Caulifigura coniformis]QDT57400.1 Phytochrome-like protein cph1 [Caulifigura coniformis]